jgi:hypothetical protein
LLTILTWLTVWVLTVGAKLARSQTCHEGLQRYKVHCAPGATSRQLGVLPLRPLVPVLAKANK